jgi:type I restriction enzyme M protein
LGGQSFYNTSPIDLSELGQSDQSEIESNLLAYVDSFSADVREIFEDFSFSVVVSRLGKTNVLFQVVQMVASIDLSPEALSNHDMGLVFEELIRRFAAGSSESAGEHFTPRDVVRLATSGGQVSRYGHPVARGGSGSLPARRLLWPPCPSTPPS